MKDVKDLNEDIKHLKLYIKELKKAVLLRERVIKRYEKLFTLIKDK